MGLEAQSRAERQSSTKRKSGFPVFEPGKGAAMIGLDDVKQEED